jgi:hypothetical protein
MRIGRELRRNGIATAEQVEKWTREMFVLEVRYRREERPHPTRDRLFSTARTTLERLSYETGGESLRRVHRQIYSTSRL